MSDSIIPTNDPSRRKTSPLRGVLTFILVVIVFFAIGVGIYYGFPYVENRVVKPIQEHGREIESIQTNQVETSRSTSSRMDEMQTQIDALSVKQDGDKEALADLRARLEGAEGWKSADTLLADRLDVLLNRLDALETAQLDLKENLKVQETENGSQTSAITDLQKKLEAQAAPLAEIQGEIVRIQALERLARGRTYLAEGNYGNARDGLAEAAAFLTERRDNLDTEQVKTVDSILERFNLAIGNLPDAPLLAEQDLNIAWELLMQTETGKIEIITPTPVPATATPAEPTPSPTITF